MSCTTILFLKLQITTSDIRPHIKWAVRLVIAHGHFNFPRGVCVGRIWILIYMDVDGRSLGVGCQTPMSRDFLEAVTWFCQLSTLLRADSYEPAHWGIILTRNKQVNIVSRSITGHFPPYGHKACRH